MHFAHILLGSYARWRCAETRWTYVFSPSSPSVAELSCKQEDLRGKLRVRSPDSCNKWSRYQTHIVRTGTSQSQGTSTRNHRSCSHGSCQGQEQKMLQPGPNKDSEDRHGHQKHRSRERGATRSYDQISLPTYQETCCARSSSLSTLLQWGWEMQSASSPGSSQGLYQASPPAERA